MIDKKWLYGGGAALIVLILLMKNSGGGGSDGAAMLAGVVGQNSANQLQLSLASIQDNSARSVAGIDYAKAALQANTSLSLGRMDSATQLAMQRADNNRFIMQGTVDAEQKARSGFFESLKNRDAGGEYAKSFAVFADTSSKFASNMALRSMDMTQGIVSEGIQSRTNLELTRMNNKTSIALGNQQTDRARLQAEVDKNASDNQLLSNVVQSTNAATSSIINTGTTSVAGTANAGIGAASSMMGGGSGGGGGGGLMSFITTILGLFGM